LTYNITGSTLLLSTTNTFFIYEFNIVFSPAELIPASECMESSLWESVHHILQLVCKLRPFLNLIVFCHVTQCTDAASWGSKTVVKLVTHKFSLGSIPSQILNVHFCTCYDQYIWGIYHVSYVYLFSFHSSSFHLFFFHSTKKKKSHVQPLINRQLCYIACTESSGLVDLALKP